MNNLNRWASLAAILLLTILVACAPGARQLDAGPDFAVAQSAGEEQALQTAKVIWHRMEAGFLQGGSYTSNVLIDLTDLPRGVAFMMESFPGESFEIRVTDDALPGVYWLVNPAGVTRHDTHGWNARGTPVAI